MPHSSSKVYTVWCMDGSYKSTHVYWDLPNEREKYDKGFEFSYKASRTGRAASE